MLYDKTGSEKSNMAAFNIYNIYINDNDDKRSLKNVTTYLYYTFLLKYEVSIHIAVL